MDDYNFDVSHLTKDDRNVVVNGMLMVLDVYDAPADIRALTSIMLLSVIDEDEWPRSALNAIIAGVNRAKALASAAIEEYEDTASDRDLTTANENLELLDDVSGKLATATLLPV